MGRRQSLSKQVKQSSKTPQKPPSLPSPVLSLQEGVTSEPLQASQAVREDASASEPAKPFLTGFLDSQVVSVPAKLPATQEARENTSAIGSLLKAKDALTSTLSSPQPSSAIPVKQRTHQHIIEGRNWTLFLCFSRPMTSGQLEDLCQPSQHSLCLLGGPPWTPNTLCQDAAALDALASFGWWRTWSKYSDFTSEMAGRFLFIFCHRFL